MEAFVSTARYQIALEQRIAGLTARSRDLPLSEEEEQELAELEAELAELRKRGKKRVSRIVAYAELKSLKGIRYSRTHLTRLENAGLFPRRVHLAEGSQQVGWFDHELDEHLATRAAAREIEEVPA